MKVVPHGRSIQSMYGEYRKGLYIVNRKYQRKLVWSLDDKRKLIDSILNGYPVPLILLAEKHRVGLSKYFEIIDGMQRLNAIFSFIENGFDIDGKYFDVSQFSTAKNEQAKGVFTPQENVSLLSPDECSKLLDYDLAISVFPAESDNEVTEVFGRINSKGRQLSVQEQRQAGVSNNVSSLVRQISSEVRGDSSDDTLNLFDMPSISIDNDDSQHGYGIRAIDTIWCNQGILTRAQLRDSEDEQIILDFIASIVNEEPISSSRELFDKLYDKDATESKELEAKLISYGQEKVEQEIIITFSTIKSMIEEFDSSPSFLRNHLRSRSKNTIKTPFFSLFMAMHDLLFKHEKEPSNIPMIFESLKGAAEKLKMQSHYSTSTERKKNIKTIKGLIQDHFVDCKHESLCSGPRLAIQIENYLSRSKIESARFETKQGFLPLKNGASRKWNKKLEIEMLNTLCGIANSGSNGAFIIGVADKKADAERATVIDGVNYLTVGERYVVGIEREAKHLGISIEDYTKKIIDVIRHSELSSSLKSNAIAGLDTVTFKGITILCISLQKMDSVSFVGKACFIRKGPATEEAVGPEILDVQARFSHSS